MIQGRLTVEGDMERAMQLGKILMKIFKEVQKAPEKSVKSK